ncbi:hypothetical protein CN692_24210 [Bacillus sp. AFS002410]|uniref:phage tail spike protein n=1 Tax=Bacillus sp. AFS002410 TaxID=2033481 RepID=UPI000BEFF18B|nr:phage tail spike protein [Bacillus sp. AFS002410]PEJ48214.1 hypothetical protein CN692_24210 [Bacillus sp. AFS002410]
MIKILNKSLKAIALLENAYDISYEKTYNQLWTASFTLPFDDPKQKHCESLNFVEVEDDKYIGLFRIIPSLTQKNESNNSVTYQMEHVLATLLDDVLFQYNQLSGYTTKQALVQLMNNQTTKHWQIGQVDFARGFDYSWENENLLSAIFSIPTPFDVPYQWTWDTTYYPWTLNLVEPDSVATCEIRQGKNLKGIEIEEDPTVIFNRIYGLGNGEGVNQLTFTKINNGLPYVEDAASIAKYGLRSYIFVDKRFEDAESLLATCNGLLESWKLPKLTIRGSAADISKITGSRIDELSVGKIVRLVHSDLGVIEQRILKESKNDITGKPGDIQLEIANLTDDIATTTTDLERRQQINELYSQGATNIDSHNYTDNCDQDNPAVIRFYLPDDLVNVNELMLYYETEAFRTYGRATKGGGATAQTSSSGGGATVTSSSGGGSTETTSTKTFIQLNVISGVPQNVVGTDNYGNHLHEVQIPGSPFTHDHNVTIPNHTHSVTTPNHTHSITLPNHTHDIEHGIYKLTELPTAVVIKVDGNTVPITSTSGSEIDIIPYLSKDSEGKIERAKWHEVTITPNDLGRINANIISRLFIQSRVGGTY